MIEEPEDDQSPVQQLINIHRHRITVVLDRMIEKLELAFSLDKLLEDDAAMVAGHLTNQQLNAVLELSTKAHKPGSTGFSTKSIGSASKTIRISKVKRSVSTEFKQDVNCSVMLAILHHNKFIMDMVKEIIESTPAAQIPFLYRMYELREYIVQMLRTSATAERAYNQQIGRSWVNNEKYKKKNAEMAVLYNNKKNELSLKINEKHAIIDRYREQMEQNRDKCITDLHKIINNSERSMARTAVASEDSQEYLTEEAKQYTAQYQSLLESHLAHEKQMRIKRYKIETVLAGWLEKYDKDVGELQEQLEVQKFGYNEEKDIFDELSERFREQTERYDFLMEEKAAEELRVFLEKLSSFLRNRAAKIIQRWFRAYLAKKYKRRKGRGKKGRRHK